MDWQMQYSLGEKSSTRKNVTTCRNIFSSSWMHRTHKIWIQCTQVKFDAHNQRVAHAMQTKQYNLVAHWLLHLLPNAIEWEPFVQKMQWILPVHTFLCSSISDKSSLFSSCLTCLWRPKAICKILSCTLQRWEHGEELRNIQGISKKYLRNIKEILKGYFLVGLATLWLALCKGENTT